MRYNTKLLNSLRHSLRLDNKQSQLLEDWWREHTEELSQMYVMTRQEINHSQMHRYNIMDVRKEEIMFELAKELFKNNLIVFNEEDSSNEFRLIGTINVLRE